MKKVSLGKLGESLAQKYLQNKGYKFIAKNFRSYFGEIDLIFIDKKVLVFVEVKTRASISYGKSFDAINRRKINSIIKTGQYFSLLHPNLSDSIRIDVLAIDEDDPRLFTIKHFQNITL